MTQTPAWRAFEKEIEAMLRQAVDPNARVAFDLKLPGRKSGTERQIDILVTGAFAGLPSARGTLVDCKHYKSKLDVNDVGTFITLVEDVGADHGLMVTDVGYSSAAVALAANTRGIHLDVVAKAVPVDVVTTRQLDEGFQLYHASHDEPYYASGSYDHEPYGPSGTNIYFAASDSDSEVLAADIDVGSPAGVRECADIILRHHLGRESSSELVETFVNELAWKFSGDDDWVVWQGELRWAW